ncbi:MAG TPA: hypothetical protein VGL23_04455 [Chloroflexota bacterium]|jgi:hypothetical protein
MRPLRTILVALALTVLLAALGLDAASAHQGDNGLIPLYGDGRLVVSGDGFGPDENLAIAVEGADGGRRRFAVTADGQGHVRLVTDLPVRPGDGVWLDARGDRGSARTTFARVARRMPWEGIDLQWLLAGALGGAIALLGGALLWSRASPRPAPTVG